MFSSTTLVGTRFYLFHGQQKHSTLPIQFSTVQLQFPHFLVPIHSHFYANLTFHCSLTTSGSLLQISCAVIYSSAFKCCLWPKYPQSVSMTPLVFHSFPSTILPSVVPGMDTLISELIATEDKEQESCVNELSLAGFPSALPQQLGKNPRQLWERGICCSFFQC